MANESDKINISLSDMTDEDKKILFDLIKKYSNHNKNNGFTRWIPERLVEQYKEEMADNHFDVDSERVIQQVNEALEWISYQEESNNYMHNLKVVCSLEWCPSGSLGIAASLFPTWNRELAYQKKQEEKKAAASVSKHVGEIGQRISFNISEAIALTSWETEWGYTTLWKIVDESGNVFTWKTSSCPDFEHAVKITGTIKAHNEFRDCKQTELTRCKLAA